MPLTYKQRLFVEAYQGKANGNATQAAIIAGYSGKTAHSIGAENLKKPEIIEALQSNQRQDAAIADRQARLRFLTQVMNGEVTESSGETAALVNRLKAVDQLNKMGGDYSETIKHDFGDQLKTAHQLLDAASRSA